MKFNSWCAAMLMGSLLAGAGCGQEVSSFQDSKVEVQWSVMPLGCDLAEIDSVEVQLENQRNSYAASSDCEQGSTWLEDVVSGRYDLTLRGKTQGGDVTFGADVQEFAVRAGTEVRTGAVELEALPGEAKINWEFDDAGGCSAAGVSSVEVIAYDKAHHEAGRGAKACDEGSLKFQKLRAGEYLFYVRSLGDGPRQEGMVTGEIGRGESVDMSVKLVDTAVQ